MTVEILSTAENFTKHCTQKGLQHTNQINSHLRASEMALFDKLLLLLVRCKNLSVLHSFRCINTCVTVCDRKKSFSFDIRLLQLQHAIRM